jgi:hypothetical protein
VTVRGTEAAAALSYGPTKHTELQIEAKHRDDPSLALKWRFHDKDGLSLMVKPALTRASWGADLAAGYERGVFELLGHVGYMRNRHLLGERASSRHASAAALWSATERLRLVVDLSRDTNADPATRAASRGVVYGMNYVLSSAVDLGLGLKKGLSDPADDRALLLGVKLRW